MPQSYPISLFDFLSYKPNKNKNKPNIEESISLNNQVVY